MSQPILIKVYAHISPASNELYQALREASQEALSAEEGEEICFHEGDMVRISFEGSYFPIDEVIAALEGRLSPKSQGKLDFIDLEAWRLTRYFLNKGSIEKRSNSLNNVLDWSGH